MLNRLIFWISLLGMILALHLWIQKARGFDQGCFGVSKPMYVADNGCRDVGDLPASHLLGVSNAAWGYAFYFGLALLSFAKIVATPVWARRIHGVGEAIVALALLYTGYLVYEMIAVAGTFCALCLVSAGLVTTLFVLHAMLRRRGGFQPVPVEARATELGIAVGGLFGAMGMLAVVVLFVNRLGTRPLDQGDTARELEDVVGQSLPAYIDRKHLTEVAACHYDWWAPPVDFAKIIRPGLPFLGKPGGVPVVMFYDPNCSFCAHHFPEFLELAERYKDRAVFYAVPRILWDTSRLQVQALKLAEGSGKYFELWKRMFEHQQKDGMNLDQIAALFRELGLPTENLADRLKAVRLEVNEDTVRIRAQGVNRLPAVYIDGRKVSNINSGATCVGRLIERELTERATGPRH